MKDAKVSGKGRQSVEGTGQEAGGRRDTVRILLFALLVHGLLLTNDGIYWDGCLLIPILQERRWDALSRLFTEIGLPQLTLLHRFMGQFPNIVFAYKCAAFLCIALGGLLTNRLCRETRLLRRQESLLVALVTLAYPAFRAAPESIILPYPLCYLLFLVAAWLVLRMERRTGLSRMVLRLLALVLFALSFTINSLLVFFFGFLFVWMRMVEGETITGSLLQRSANFLKSRIDFLLLPMVFWVVKQRLMTAHGTLYSEYNRVTLSPLTILTRALGFLLNSVYAQWNESLQRLIQQPALLLLIVLLVTTLFREKNEKEEAKEITVSPTGLFRFGIVLFFLGVFPYAAVGNVATAQGWESRHALLVALPVALIVLAGIRRFFTATNGNLTKPGIVCLALLLTGFSLTTLTNYLSWQTRWIKTRSMVLNLRDNSNAKNFSVYRVDDQFPTTDTLYFFEWASVFKEAWGGETRIGLDRSWAGADDFLAKETRYFNERFLLGQFNPQGRQARMIVRRTTPMTDIELCNRYLELRLLRPARLESFLRSVTTIEVGP